MRSLLITGILFLALYSQAQDTTKCDGERVFVKAEQMPVFKKSIDSLKIFFATGLSTVGFENANGTLLLEIIVCSSGKATLSTFSNKTDIPANESAIKELVGTMSTWKPGFQNGRLVDCWVQLEFILEHGRVAGFHYQNNSH
jgi:hypothetical protein